MWPRSFEARPLPGLFLSSNSPSQLRQNKTVDNVIISSADAMKNELFYAAANRGRSEIAVVTGDREILRESIGGSHRERNASMFHVDQFPRSIIAQQSRLAFGEFSHEGAWDTTCPRVAIKGRGDPQAALR